jgi:hypothetical protein
MGSARQRNLGQLQQYLVALIVFCAPWSVVWLISHGNQTGPVENSFLHLALYPLEILMLISAGIWLLTGSSRREIRRLAPLFACAVLAIVSAVWARQPELALASGIHILVATLFAGVLADQLRKPAGEQRLLGVFLASMVLQALWGLIQTATGSDLGLRVFGEGVLSTTALGVAKVSGSGDVILRAYGSLPHPNVLAGYLLVALLLGLGALLSSHANSRRQSALAIFLGLLGAGLLATYSRVALAAALLGSATVIIYAFKQRKALPKQLLLALPVVALAAAVMFGALLQRGEFNSPRESGVDNRAAGITFAVDSALRHPLGVGAGNATVAIAADRSDLPYYQQQPPHLVILVVVLELGWLGLALILYFVFVTARDFHANHVNGTKERIAHLTLVIIAGGLLASSLFDHFLWSLPQGLWLAAGFVGIVLSKLDAPAAHS